MRKLHRINNLYAEARCLLEHSLEETERAITLFEKMNVLNSSQASSVDDEWINRDVFVDGQKIVTCRLVKTAGRIDYYVRHNTLILSRIMSKVKYLLSVDYNDLISDEDAQSYLDASQTISQDIHTMSTNIKTAHRTAEALLQTTELEMV